MSPNCTMLLDFVLSYRILWREGLLGSGVEGGAGQVSPTCDPHIYTLCTPTLTYMVPPSLPPSFPLLPSLPTWMLIQWLASLAEAHIRRSRVEAIPRWACILQHHLPTPAPPDDLYEQSLQCSVPSLPTPVYVHTASLYSC